MTFAADNAGPGRLKQLGRETEMRALDPNVWFGNVERVASERSAGNQSPTSATSTSTTSPAVRCPSSGIDAKRRRADVAKRK